MCCKCVAKALPIETSRHPGFEGRILVNLGSFLVLAGRPIPRCSCIIPSMLCCARALSAFASLEISVVITWAAAPKAKPFVAAEGYDVSRRAFSVDSFVSCFAAGP